MRRTSGRDHSPAHAADVTTSAPERDEDRPDAPAAGAPRTGLVLAVCCVAQFLVILDLSIINVALPTIQSALRISAVHLQWVIDAYAIVFAGFLMLAGARPTCFGQRRMFTLALAAFRSRRWSPASRPTARC